MIPQTKKSTMEELIQEVSKVPEPATEVPEVADDNKEDLMDEKDEREDDEVRKTDSLSIAASDDNTQLRLDTVIKIKSSDLSVAEEKKEDEDVVPVQQNDKDAEEVYDDEPTETPETEAEAAEDIAAAVAKMEEEIMSSRSEESKVSETEQAKKPEVDEIMSLRSEETTEEADQPSTTEKTEEKAPSTKEIQPEAKEPESTTNEELVAPEEQAKEKEPSGPFKEGKVNIKETEVLEEPMPSSGEKEESAEATIMPAEEAADGRATAQPTVSEDSDKPVAEAAVTTKHTASVDSDQPMDEPMITTKSTSMTEASTDKVTKTVQFAEDTVLSGKTESEDTDEPEEATTSSGAGRIFTCGEPLCGNLFDADKETLKENENTLELEEEADEAKPDDVTATETVVPTSEIGPTSEEKREVGEEMTEVVSGEEPQEEDAATVVAPDAQLETPKPVALEIVQPSVNDDIVMMSTSPIARRLQNNAASFDAQEGGMSCGAVFSCGILSYKPRTIPMSLSQDFIMEAREEAEREVEARVEGDIPVTVESKPENATTGEANEESPVEEDAIAEINTDAVEEQQQPDEPEKKAEAVTAEELPSQNESQAPFTHQSKAEQPKEEALVSEAPETEAANETTMLAAENTAESVSPSPAEDAVVLPKDAAAPMAAPAEGVVVVDDFEKAAVKAHQEAYATCGCTIL